jgi:hypothetical protein
MKRTPNPPGRCIFCDRLGVTKEHMWADWLRNYIPRELDRHTVALQKVHLTETERNFERRTGDPHSRRIKCVCRQCNNVWMSQLQEAAKPYLVPILTGNTVTLHRNGQTTLAAWTAMMVMVAEHLNEQMVAIPTSDRKWLRSKIRPPSHWRIWIGRHDRTSHPLFTHNVLSFAFEKEIQRIGLEAAVPVNAQTSTILLGQHLLIHVMSSAVARNIVRRWQLPAALAPSLVQIWPITRPAVTWPPQGGVLRDTAIVFLADHFFNAGNYLARERALSAR